MSHDRTDVGDEILVGHESHNLDGELEDSDTVVLTVTLPDLTTEQPAVANPPESTGQYLVSYTLEQAGRYVFSWQTTNPNTASAAAVDVRGIGALPVLQDVKDYLEDAVDSWSDAQLTEVLAAETAAQSKVCRIRAYYPADLREALLRRVARNLALRALPLAVLQGDSEEGNLVLPGRDPEVRRLEGPHRKVVVG